MHHAKDVSEHCADCAADQRRTDLAQTAVDVIAIEDDRLTGLQSLRESAVKYLQKHFDQELLPKTL